ncbi:MULTISPECIES: hypothetical protein [Maricaulis]|jgi:hypothetical protein|nr:MULTISPECIES: hypothetical protein [Maricaulis]
MINAYALPVAPAAALTGERAMTLGLLLLVLVLITSSITGAVGAPA